MILLPDATVAEALALVRNPDLSPALAAQVFVVRPPQATPTGRYLGTAHLQRLLREPPSSLVSGLADRDPAALRPDTPIAAVTRHLATYNLVAVPVVDDNDRLLGAVSVDDVLDHLLPEDWRDVDVDNDEAAPHRRGTIRTMADRWRGRGWTSRTCRVGACGSATTRRPSVAPPRRSRASWAPAATWWLQSSSSCCGSCVEHPAGHPALRPVPAQLPHAGPVVAGRLRRAADPARAEPAGRPRPGQPGRGPGQASRPSADAEYLAREIAAIRIALGDVVTRDYLRSELSRLDRGEDRETRRASGRRPAQPRRRASQETASPGRSPSARPGARREPRHRRRASRPGQRCQGAERARREPGAGVSNAAEPAAWRDDTGPTDRPQSLSAAGAPR